MAHDGGEITERSWQMLTRLALAEFLAMTMWFSATAVAGGLKSEFHMSDGQAAWLTMAVQAGFVTGALVSAMLNLSDVFNARWVFAAGAVIGAIANAAVTQAGSTTAAIAWRFATGAALACVYPPGMKIASGWFRSRRATALGIVVGALTLGTAVPHLLAAMAVTVGWRPLLLCTSAAALVAAAVVLAGVGDGPFVAKTAPFDPSAVAGVFANRGARLAIFGYLGHMWELYAMWTWMALFASLSFIHAGLAYPGRFGSLLAFSVVGAGGIGCAVAGTIADRIGKARVARLALIVSGCCSACAGFFFGVSPPILFALAIVWGVAVVADSSQFSALVVEHSPAHHVGTALTVQLCSGFLLTMVSIRLLPVVAAAIGWQWAFLALVPGPVAGIVAMRALERTDK